MSQAVSTTVSVAHRAISVHLDTGETERFALVQTSDGDVFWRHDTFGPDADGVLGAIWLRHGGRLTVAQLLERVPQCEQVIRTWTRDEIESGAALPELDVFGRHVRHDALERLDAQLRTA